MGKTRDLRRAVAHRRALLATGGVRGATPAPAPATLPTEPQADGWICFSALGGRHFFHHHTLGLNVWERPEDGYRVRAATATEQAQYEAYEALEAVVEKLGKRKLATTEAEQTVSMGSAIQTIVMACRKVIPQPPIHSSHHYLPNQALGVVGQL